MLYLKWKPLAPIPANLKNVITDQVLDARLHAAGLSVENPPMREKLRESLYVGMQYAALPLTDPRFLGHAEHSGDGDMNGIKQQLAGLGQKIITVQEQGAKAMTRLQEKWRSRTQRSMGLVRIAAAAVGGVISYLTLVKRIKGAGIKSRLLGSLGIAAAAGALVGHLTGRVMGSGVEKEREDIIREGRGFETEYQQTAQAVQGFEQAVKEEFLNVHMQRAVKKQAQHQANEAQHLLQQTNHLQATNHHSAGEETPRIHPHTPIANAHMSHAAGEDGPRLNAHVPVAAAHDGGHASAENTHQPTAHESHAGGSQGTSADVAGAVGKFTSMHAPKGHEGSHAAAIKKSSPARLGLSLVKRECLQH